MYRLISLAGPDLSGSARPSRLVSAASRLVRRLPDSTALSSYRAAATALRGGLAPPSIPSASRRTHDLRHTHKTWLIEDDVHRVLQLQRLGHKRKDASDLYSHVTQAMLAALQRR